MVTYELCLCLCCSYDFVCVCVVPMIYVCLVFVSICCGRRASLLPRGPQAESGHGLEGPQPFVDLFASCALLCAHLLFSCVVCLLICTC